MNAEFAQLLAGMRDDFISNLHDCCDLLERGVLALEHGGSEAFYDLYRQVHNLKGSAATFGLDLVTRTCHQFESFISESRERFDPLMVSYALNYVDLLRRIAEAASSDSMIASGIEHDLEQLRISSMPGCASVLLVEPSDSTRRFCQEVLEQLPIRLVSQDRAMPALELLLHQPFDLLVAARELPGLNALALVAALRESGCRNKNIPVILISSNTNPVPEYLKINASIKRDAEFVTMLSRCAGDVLASCSN